MRYPNRRFISNSSATLLFASALVTAGCNSAARYEVVAPGNARGAVAPNAGAIVTRDKIDYEIFQADDKVILRFVNRTGKPLHLTEQSVALDATGRSFVLGMQDVAPDTSGRIVLPPAFATESARPVAVATEVHIGGVDEGGMIGSRRDVETNDETGTATAGAAAPPPGFRWPSGGQARVRLIYHVGDATDDLTHEWAIRRTK